MNIFVKLNESELLEILRRRNIEKHNNHEILINDFPLYVDNEELSKDIQNEIDFCLSVLILNNLEESRQFKVSYILKMGIVDNVYVMKMRFQELKQSPVYLNFYFDEKNILNHISYTDKLGNETKGLISDSYCKENSNAGIYGIFNHFKSKVLKLKIQKKKPSKDYKVVKFENRKIRFHESIAGEIQESIQELIELARQVTNNDRNCVVTSSLKAKNGMREITLRLRCSKDEFKCTMESDAKFRKREIIFLVYEDTFQYVSHKVNVQDVMFKSTSTRERENEYVSSMSLLEQIKWIKENKI